MDVFKDGMVSRIGRLWIRFHTGDRFLSLILRKSVRLHESSERAGGSEALVAKMD